MESRRIKIMESTIRLFSRKGYFLTSMQEIATDCNISKGSLYKYFSSKDDLLIQVFKYNHDKMVRRVKHIISDHSLVPKEKLKQMIKIEFEGILENKEYFSLLSNKLPTDKNKEFSSLLKKIKAEMVSWHKEVLTQIYGEEIKSYRWDLVMTLQGILKEYIHLTIQDKKQIDAKQVANYVVYCLDAIIHYHDKPIPVLNDESMKEYKAFVIDQEPLSLEAQVLECLKSIQTELETRHINHETKQDLLSSINLLEEEIQEKDPRKFLIQALLKNLDEQGVDDELHAIRSLLEIKG